jgi:hypothetical protein
MADPSKNYPKETPKVIYSKDKPEGKLSRKKRKKGKGPGENPWWPWIK